MKYNINVLFNIDQVIDVFNINNKKKVENNNKKKKILHF